MTKPTLHPSKSVQLWLCIVYLMILAMVAVGGITRLTGSGLSMTEWHPLMGWIPPLTPEAWTDVFALYKACPQYLEVNHWMQLEDFKRIFFWEYVHRVLGRLIGVVFFLPWLVFVLRKSLQGAWIGRTLVAFFLGGAQGFLGWFMVQSGLVDVPEVSHYRLAAHLSLAFLLGGYILWLVLDIQWPERIKKPALFLKRTLVFSGLLGVQVVYGAFMAGTKSGILYPSFPDFLGRWFPAEAWEGSSVWMTILSNGHMIHAVHRWLGWIVALVGIGVAASIWRGAQTRRQKALSMLLIAVVSAQFALGVWTVLSLVSLWVAVSHQVLGFLLVCVTVALLHSLRRTR